MQSLERRIRRSALAAAGVLALVPAGCADRDAEAATGERWLPEPGVEWTLEEAPAISIGAVEGRSEYLLHYAISSVQLPDGRIVILDGGSHQLRFYDAKGEHLGSTGTKGSGPGEFRRPVRLWLTHPDTIVVFDVGTDLRSWFDGVGRFVRAEKWQAPEDEPFPLDAWLYGRAFIDGPTDPARRAPVRALIDRLPPAPAGGFHSVRVDDEARVWVRTMPADPAQPAEWHVYALDGAPLGRVHTPAGFEIQSIGHDFVLGRVLDQFNVEHIQLWHFNDVPAARPQAWAAAAPSADGSTETSAEAASAPTEEQLVRMRGVLRTLMTLQEIFYSKPENGYSYASRADQLEWPEDMEGFVVHILNAGPMGYGALLFHITDPLSCGVAIGLTGPIGWTPGIVHCS